jgi:hypothetical protein
VILPQVLLYHFESATRGYEDSPEKLLRLSREKEELRNLWPAYFESDPFFDTRLVFKNQAVYLRASQNLLIKLT